MLNPLPVQAAREDLFVERYDHLLAWSLQMTEHDHELAEDLLHDLFIQFTLNAPDLHKIKNLDGYLYTMLRNLYLTQRRRDTRNTLQQLSIVEYDSAEVGLRTVDLRDQIRAQDDLRRVCHYACARKETAKIGSVLILRFFHGYYLEEIVRVLRTSRTLVDTFLKLARREAKAELLSDTGKANRLEFINRNRVTEVLPSGYARSVDVFLEELRQTIFQNRHGACFTDDSLKQLYSAETVTALESSQLSHILSCRQCLDKVNRLLGLPVLGDRSATETLGRDTRKPGGGGGGTGGGGLSKLALNKLRRRVKDTFAHKPLELCVSVNGYTLGSQRVSSERSELNLVVDQDVRVSFVEVFSEQKIRLLVMAVEELPPDGPGEQSIRVELSDQRLLDLTLRLASPSPTIQVVYSDPHFNEVPDTAAALEGVSTDPIHEHSASSTVSSLAEGASARESIQQLPSSENDRSALRRFYRALASFWLRPATVTTLFALILIASLFLYLRAPTPIVSPAELLSRAIAAEETIAARKDQVLHRTINLEEHRSSGELITRHRIEVWQSAEKGVTARRLYDDKDHLVAGDWRRADGVQTLYSHGQQPQLQLTPEKRGARDLPLTFDNVWQLSPSAREFASLVGRSDAAHLEDRPTSYVISYAGEDNNRPGLVRVSLVLSRDDLHPTEQTLTIQQGNEQREYRFVETSFERRPVSAVAPAVFEPDAVLLSDAATSRRQNAESLFPSPHFPITPSPVAATAELEVEVLRLLNEAKADLGEQVTVTRTPGGGPVQVQAMVETEARKTEIVRALSSVTGNPAVRIEIETVAEALKRQPQNKPSSGPLVVQKVESASNENPIEQELRRYFAAKDENRADEQARRFADETVGDSQQAMRHAWALKRLLNQFSPEDIRSLSPEARAKWLALIHAQARAFEQGARRLREKIAPILFPSASGPDARDDSKITDDAELARAVEQLFALASANDAAIRSAFAFSTESASGNGIKSPRFWQSLKTAESLAGRITSSQ